MTTSGSALSGSTSSPETFAQIRAWLRICEQHDTCNCWAQINGLDIGLPLRLLDVGQRSGRTDFRLVYGEMLPPQESRYMTLSHCWGVEPILKLTSANLDAFCNGMSETQLPKSFQDAISIARYLDIRYLWIDALCILQDSSLDWKIQAQTMAQVYSGSYLNIAASDSSNSSGGLFSERDKTLPVRFTVSLKCTPQADRILLCHFDAFEDDMERYLAPRVVHYTRRMVYWECTATTASEAVHPALESGFGDIRQLKKFNARVLQTHNLSSEATQVIYALWDNLITVYTRGNLTYGSDKAIAIQGVAKVICRYLRLDERSAYVNGLWRPKFVDGLMWICERSQDSESRGPLDSGACSWSWLSRRGSIWSSHGGGIPVSQVLEIQADCTLNTPTAAAGGFARLRGPMCRAVVSFAILYFDDPEQYITTEASEHEIYLLLGRAMIDSECTAGKDILENAPSWSGYDYECLAVEPVERRPGHFRRAGTAVLAILEKDDEGRRTIATMEEDKRLRKVVDTQFQTNDISEDLYKSFDDFMYTITLV
ncbi:hypothetical protein LTR91_016616 [Friedmanniomyces endolithicus]|uniref:Heterokaryon incompatibility domain-containing protein n=1 Tax=Friedmanniomyces endolithicus TaxID=329885 RepID=A0AAN6QKH5_9PEZI|nr:hypothetical protein LTR57_011182 [Friedmanniomyces endolithicus]KAK0968749.1 hypothetical protein LTR91_016616 [Friedmanniomyces endolithicus]KAK0987047.1 hypothetical protein LTS01_009646 [Friedmanniomyces endolithicus]